MIINESGMILRNFGMLSLKVGRTAFKKECSTFILMTSPKKILKLMPFSNRTKQFRVKTFPNPCGAKKSTPKWYGLFLSV
jgi:hypothetical protein